MSEVLSSSVGNLASYQDFVKSVSTKNLGDDWKLNSAEFLTSEATEALTQHGGAEAIAIFLPEKCNPEFEPTDVSSETRFGIADEIGDSLWFTVDCINRCNSTIATACTIALDSFGIDTDYELRTFYDVQRYVVDNADKIQYITKAGLITGYKDIKTAPDHFLVSLPENPLLHFTRTNRKLARALEEGSRDIAPYASGAYFEPPADVPLAAGQHLLTMAWLAECRLGVSLNGIAAFNHDKLVHRAIHGKENDIHFDESYATL